MQKELACRHTLVFPFNLVGTKTAAVQFLQFLYFCQTQRRKYDKNGTFSSCQGEESWVCFNSRLSNKLTKWQSDQSDALSATSCRISVSFVFIGFPQLILLSLNHLILRAVLVGSLNNPDPDWEFVGSLNNPEIDWNSQEYIMRSTGTMTLYHVTAKCYLTHSTVRQKQTVNSTFTFSDWPIKDWIVRVIQHFSTITAWVRPWEWCDNWQEGWCVGCSTQERWVPWVGLETGRDRVTDVQTETCFKLEKSEYLLSLRGLRLYVTSFFILLCS